MLQTRVQCLERGEAVLNRRTDRCADFDALWQQIDRFHLRVGYMIALDDIRTGFAMRRLDLEVVALEIVHRNGLKSRVQRFEF